MLTKTPGINRIEVPKKRTIRDLPPIHGLARAPVHFPLYAQISLEKNIPIESNKSSSSLARYETQRVEGIARRKERASSKGNIDLLSRGGYYQRTNQGS